MYIYLFHVYDIYIYIYNIYIYVYTWILQGCEIWAPKNPPKTDPGAEISHPNGGFQASILRGAADVTRAGRRGTRGDWAALRPQKLKEYGMLNAWLKTSTWGLI